MAIRSQVAQGLALVLVAIGLLSSSLTHATESTIRLLDAFPKQPDFERPVVLLYDQHDTTHYYVAEQYGRVFRIPRDGSRSDRELVLDLREQVLSPQTGGNNEEGLLGLAFAPDTQLTPYVYLSYSERVGRRKRQSVVSRMAIVRDQGKVRFEPREELRIVEVAQPAGNHNGGAILFGPDQMLWIALGDGGASKDKFKNGQNLESLLGAILRIDVSGASAAQPYRIPEDNPFVGREAARPEIWAYGVRNPWRMSFDSKTGEGWFADVGQNRWEEVDRLVRGGNYGWPLREGRHRFSGPKQQEPRADLIEPVAEYPRSSGYSVTGGHVYRGHALPDLGGHYIYGDYASGKIWSVRPSVSDGLGAVTLLIEGEKSIASFAEEPSGEHLMLSFDGRIYRLVPR